MPMYRAIFEIAREIQRTWPKPYFGAVPYIEAMLQMVKITDDYGYDRGQDIVRYFLANASTYRGADARRIKAELKEILNTA
jgi:hypothetical protein